MEEYSHVMKQKLTRIEEFYEEEPRTHNKLLVIDEIVQLSKI